jgi:exopolyphosphatase/guanosine-5'-triphosphate,3'-diphosphate pyrophosphatase
VRVGVIDIGSNTGRLLVAQRTRNGAEPVGQARTYLRLGAEIQRTGGIGREKLDEAAEEARRFATVARELGASALDIFITAPGRQAANADELVAEVTRATGHVARVLSSREEGELAWEGAVATTPLLREPIAVCDVGGGSTQVTVGDRRNGVHWSRSFAVGSLRLTAGMLDRDPPSPDQLRQAAAYVEERLAGLEAPAVGSVLAVGGSARAVSRLAGRTLDEEALERALELIGSRSVDRLTRELPVDAARAATLAGGATILLGVATRLGRPLELGRAGLREGAVNRLLARRQAA